MSFSENGIREYYKFYVSEVENCGTGYVNLSKKQMGLYFKIPLVSTIGKDIIKYGLTARVLDNYNASPEIRDDRFYKILISKEFVTKKGENFSVAERSDGSYDIYIYDESNDYWENLETGNIIKKPVDEEQKYYVLVDKNKTEYWYKYTGNYESMIITDSFPTFIKRKGYDDIEMSLSQIKNISGEITFSTTEETERKLLEVISKNSKEKDIEKVELIYSNIDDDDDNDNDNDNDKSRLGSITRTFYGSNSNEKQEKYTYYIKNNINQDIYLIYNEKLRKGVLYIINRVESEIKTITIKEINNWNGEIVGNIVGNIKTTTIEYISDYKTKVTDYRGREYYYFFDDSGRCIFESDYKCRITNYGYNIDSNKISSYINSEDNRYITSDLRHNLVKNGYFKDLSGWNLCEKATLVEDDTNVFSKFLEVGETNKVLKIEGDSSEKFVSQIINEPLVKGDKLLVSCFMKRNVLMPCSISIELKKSLDGNTVSLYSEYVDYISEWEHICFSIDVPETINIIQVKLKVNGTGNTYFDGVQICKRSKGGVYFAYDGDNNLTTIGQSKEVASEQDENADKKEVASEQDENADKIEYNLENKISSITAKDGSVTNFEYDDLGRLTKEKQGNGVETTYEYDNNNVKRKTVMRDDGKYLLSKATYDVESETETGDYYIDEETSESNVVTTTKRNYTKNETVSIATGLMEKELAYTEKSLLSSVKFKHQNYAKFLKTHNISYDNKDFLSELSDGVNYTYEMEYDDYDRLTKVKLISGTDSIDLCEYTYYKINGYETDLVKEKIIGEHTFTFEYNNDDQINLIAYEKLGVLYFAYLFCYDKLGRLIKVIDGSTVIKSYEYDEYNRVITEIEDDVKKRYIYDDDGNVAIKKYELNEEDKLIVCYGGNSSTKGLNKGKFYEASKKHSNMYTATYEDNFEASNITYNNSKKVETILNRLSTGEMTTGKYNAIDYIELSTGGRPTYKLGGLTNDAIGVMFWFKNSGNNENNRLMSMSWDNLYNSVDIYLKSDNRVTIKIIDKNGVGYDNVVTTTEPIKLDDWNFLCFSMQKDTIANGHVNYTEIKLGLNDEIKTTMKVNPRYDLDYSSACNISIGCNKNMGIEVQKFNGKVALLTLTKYLLLDEVVRNHQKNSFDYVINNEYIEDGELIQKSDSVVTHNFAYKTNILDTYDVVPLNGTFESIKGVKPIERNENNVLNNSFRYEKATEHYMYRANGQDLVYNFGFTNSGTIIMKVKVDENYEQQYLFQLFSEDGANTLSLVRVSTRIFIEFDGTRINTGLDLNKNDIKLVGMSYIKQVSSSSISKIKYNIKVMVGSQKFVTEIASSTELSLPFISVGRRNNPRVVNRDGIVEEYVDPLYGYIDLLCFGIATPSDATWNNFLDIFKNTVQVSKYDALGILRAKEIKQENVTVLKNRYTYDSDGDRIIPIVKNEYITSNQTTENIEYSYDEYMNVTEIKVNNVRKKLYEYNLKNELIREHDFITDEPVSYTIDDYGNITKKVKLIRKDEWTVTEKTINYTYGTGINKNTLLSYNGTQIIYGDTYKGNPTKIGTHNLEWQGKRLTKYDNLNFTYNENEQRVRKGNYSYVYDGNLLIKQTDGTNSLYFLYDSYDCLSGFKYGNETFFYVRDILNNIKGIVDINGNYVVKYNYDAYGNTLSIEGSAANTIGIINPFRYKGYYYDIETGLYYVTTRYYNPEWGRWISPDSIEYLDSESINGLNLYAYCFNNSIKYKDSSGKFPVIIELFGDVVSELTEVLGNIIYKQAGNYLDNPLTIKQAQKIIRKRGLNQSARSLIREHSDDALQSIKFGNDLNKFSKHLKRGMLVADLTFSFAENLASGDESWFTDFLVDGAISLGIFLIPGGFLFSFMATLATVYYEDEIEKFKDSFHNKWCNFWSFSWI